MSSQDILDHLGKVVMALSCHIMDIQAQEVELERELPKNRDPARVFVAPCAPSTVHGLITLSGVYHWLEEGCCAT